MEFADLSDRCVVRTPDGCNYKKRSYRIWRSIIGRMFASDEFTKKKYAGRGITLCQRWMEYANFVIDMGECPSESHSIDRIDNNGGYSKDNCRWATSQEQAWNRRSTLMVEIRGVTKPVAQWALESGRKYWTIYRRLRRGLTPEEAVYGSMRNRPSKSTQTLPLGEDQ